MGKFKLFRWDDVLSFDLAAFVLTGFAIYATVAEVNPNGQAIALFWCVCGLVWLVCGAFLYSRAKWLKIINYVTREEMAVISNQFTVPQDKFEAIVEETISKWESATRWGGCRDTLNGLTVIFKPFPIDDYANAGKLAGYTLGDNCVVGFKDSLEATALSHELGHVIHAKWIGFFNADLSHAFMAAHNLG